MNGRRAIVIGAGPAGLTAAYELLTRSRMRVLVLEKSGYMGGISRTVHYKGNRIDIGGHRFFSRSDRVMQWWLRFSELRSYLDGFENLFLMGRNGMHRYNNQDHSMLTAMAAVDAILAGSTGKSSIWAVTPDAE